MVGWFDGWKGWMVGWLERFDGFIIGRLVFYSKTRGDRYKNKFHFTDRHKCYGFHF